MFDLLFAVALVGTVSQIIKESCAPTIPAENWANKDLIHKDRMSGISEKEFSKNLANGKYKLTETYPEPHRMEDGRIIIENYELYKKDIENYGVLQAHKWVEQGKYNLSPEEVKKREEEFKVKMERIYELGRNGSGRRRRRR